MPVSDATDDQRAFCVQFWRKKRASGRGSAGVSKSLGLEAFAAQEHGLTLAHRLQSAWAAVRAKG